MLNVFIFQPNYEIDFWPQLATFVVWALADIIRYVSYIAKIINPDGEKSLLSSVTEWMRFNCFLVFYPVGYAAELAGGFSGTRKLLLLDDDDKIPYTLRMPNQFNVSFDFLFFITYTARILGTIAFFVLFPHMLASRASYYKKKAAA